MSPPAPVHKTNLFNTFFLGAKWGDKRQLECPIGNPVREERRGSEICNNKYVTTDWFFFENGTLLFFLLCFFNRLFSFAFALSQPISSLSFVDQEWLFITRYGMARYGKVWQGKARQGKVRFPSRTPRATRYTLRCFVQASISFQKRTRRKGKREKKASSLLSDAVGNGRLQKQLITLYVPRTPYTYQPARLLFQDKNSSLDTTTFSLMGTQRLPYLTCADLVQPYGMGFDKNPHRVERWAETIDLSFFTRRKYRVGVIR